MGKQGKDMKKKFLTSSLEIHQRMVSSKVIHLSKPSMLFQSMDFNALEPTPIVEMFLNILHFSHNQCLAFITP